MQHVNSKGCCTFYTAFLGPLNWIQHPPSFSLSSISLLSDARQLIHMAWLAALAHMPWTWLRWGQARLVVEMNAGWAGPQMCGWAPRGFWEMRSLSVHDSADAPRRHQAACYVMCQSCTCVKNVRMKEYFYVLIKIMIISKVHGSGRGVSH